MVVKLFSILSITLLSFDTNIVWTDNVVFGKTLRMMSSHSTSISRLNFVFGIRSYMADIKGMPKCPTQWPGAGDRIGRTRHDRVRYSCARLPLQFRAIILIYLAFRLSRVNFLFMVKHFEIKNLIVLLNSYFVLWQWFKRFTL